MRELPEGAVDLGVEAWHATKDGALLDEQVQHILLASAPKIEAAVEERVREGLLKETSIHELTKQIVEGANGEVISLPYEVVKDALGNVLVSLDPYTEQGESDDPCIVIAGRMTSAEARCFVKRACLANPDLRGADVADILDIFDNGDVMVAETERFYAKHGDHLPGEYGPLRNTAVIAAAVLQPDDMLPLVERLFRPNQEENEDCDDL